MRGGRTSGGRCTQPASWASNCTLPRLSALSSLSERSQRPLGPLRDRPRPRRWQPNDLGAVEGRASRSNLALPRMPAWHCQDCSETAELSRIARSGRRVCKCIRWCVDASEALKSVYAPRRECEAQRAVQRQRLDACGASAGRRRERGPRRPHLQAGRGGAHLRYDDHPRSKGRRIFGPTPRITPARRGVAPATVPGCCADEALAAVTQGGIAVGRSAGSLSLTPLGHLPKADAARGIDERRLKWCVWRAALGSALDVGSARARGTESGLRGRSFTS
eukprot:364639-Chlamydomonas_euryale.AAC.31